MSLFQIQNIMPLFVYLVTYYGAFCWQECWPNFVINVSDRHRLEIIWPRLTFAWHTFRKRRKLCEAMFMAVFKLSPVNEKWVDKFVFECFFFTFGSNWQTFMLVQCVGIHLHNFFNNSFAIWVTDQFNHVYSDCSHLSPFSSSWQPFYFSSPNQERLVAEK